MSSKRTLIAVVSILCLISVTLYLAFAFPLYSLFQLRQAENNELKSVIIVTQPGDYLPLLDPYSRGDYSFSSTYKPDLDGQQQLTNMGKERMFLLGKFLKLRYYSYLLEGNPQRVSARSVSTDHGLESAQAFLAGLNPAQDNWCWSAAACSELAGWQPKAIHSFPSRYDDLLVPQMSCPLLSKNLELQWKQSESYQQLLESYKSTLETLETNTSLNLTKKLELMPLIENWLNTREKVAGDEDDTISQWYTDELANQLTNLTDSVMKSYLDSSSEAQKLQIGRLLNEVMHKIDERIKLEEQRHLGPKNPDKDPQSEQPAGVAPVNGTVPQNGSEISTAVMTNSTTPSNNFSTIEQPFKNLVEPPNVYLYMTDGRQLKALMNSLQIDSSQQTGPGDLLLIELHRSSITQSFYLRLFSISSTAPDVFPEPIQVKTIACGDSSDCSPDQLRQAIKPLMLDETTWSRACTLGTPFDLSTEMQPTTTPSIPIPSVPHHTTTSMIDVTTMLNKPAEDNTPPTSSDAPTSSSTPADPLSDTIIVGPVHPVPLPNFQHNNFSSSINSTSESNLISDVIETTTFPEPSKLFTQSQAPTTDQGSFNSTQTHSNSTLAPNQQSTTTPLEQTLPPRGQVSVLVATLDYRNN